MFVAGSVGFFLGAGLFGSSVLCEPTLLHAGETSRRTGKETNRRNCESIVRAQNGSNAGSIPANYFELVEMCNGC